MPVRLLFSNYKSLLLWLCSAALSATRDSLLHPLNPYSPSVGVASTSSRQFPQHLIQSTVEGIIETCHLTSSSCCRGRWTSSFCGRSPAGPNTAMRSHVSSETPPMGASTSSTAPCTPPSTAWKSAAGSKASGVSQKGKRAKFYRLTTAGRRALRSEAATWQQYVAAVGKVLRAEPA